MSVKETIVLDMAKVARIRAAVAAREAEAETYENLYAAVDFAYERGWMAAADRDEYHACLTDESVNPADVAFTLGEEAPTGWIFDQDSLTFRRIDAPIYPSRATILAHLQELRERQARIDELIAEIAHHRAVVASWSAARNG